MNGYWGLEIWGVLNKVVFFLKEKCQSLENSYIHLLVVQVTYDG